MNCEIYKEKYLLIFLKRYNKIYFIILVGLYLLGFIFIAIISLILLIKNNSNDLLQNLFFKTTCISFGRAIIFLISSLNFIKDTILIILLLSSIILPFTYIFLANKIGFGISIFGIILFYTIGYYSFEIIMSI